MKHKLFLIVFLLSIFAFSPNVIAADVDTALQAVDDKIAADKATEATEARDAADAEQSKIDKKAAAEAEKYLEDAQKTRDDEIKKIEKETQDRLDDINETLEDADKQATADAADAAKANEKAAAAAEEARDAALKAQDLSDAGDTKGAEKAMADAVEAKEDATEAAAAATTADNVAANSAEALDTAIADAADAELGIEEDKTYATERSEAKLEAAEAAAVNYIEDTANGTTSSLPSQSTNSTSSESTSSNSDDKSDDFFKDLWKKMTGEDPTGGNQQPGVALDQYFINFILNIRKPLVALISIVAFLMGVIMEMIAISRITKPGFTNKGTAAGTVAMVIIGALLVSLPATVNNIENTFFGQDQTGMEQEWSQSDLSYTDGAQTGTGEGNERLLRAINAAFQYIRILGLIAFIRGLFLFKTMVDGGQASTLSALMHTIGGVFAMNIAPIIRIFYASL